MCKIIGVIDNWCGGLSVGTAVCGAAVCGGFGGWGLCGGVVWWGVAVCGGVGGCVVGLEVGVYNIFLSDSGQCVQNHAALCISEFFITMET